MEEVNKNPVKGLKLKSLQNDLVIPQMLTSMFYFSKENKPF